jgi:hypothetical protein
MPIKVQSPIFDIKINHSNMDFLYDTLKGVSQSFSASLLFDYTQIIK